MKRSLILLTLFLMGFLIWICPEPVGVSLKAWHLFAIFITTIFGIILKPLPLGGIVLISLAVSTLTHTLTLEEALSGFQSHVAWLVLFAFFIARAFIKTGLGSRIAYYFISIFGKKTLGLSYSILLSDVLLAPAIPSVTARSGGIIFPIVQGLAKSFGSDPHLGTEKRVGSFLMKVAYQGSVISSTMFLTAMAANPFLAGLAEEAGYHLSWGTWALGALLPGILSLIFMPWLVYKIYPPVIKESMDAVFHAREKLAEMGKLDRREWFMMIILILMILLWIFGGFFSLHATVTALLGVALLLITDILSWKEMTAEETGWDTFFWFAALIMMASALNRFGFISWLSGQVIGMVGGMEWPVAFIILEIVYFYTHYFFASSTAHVGAMFPAFFMMAIGLGTPPSLALLVFAFSSSLFGGLTHYGSSAAPLFFGSGYVDVKAWWRIGFFVSLLNIFFWLVIGPFWWKLFHLW